MGNHKLSKAKYFNMIRNKANYKGCLHSDHNCSSLTSKAHSVQNNRILSKISENGNVLCIDFSKLPLNKKNRLVEVGRNKASTFTGFCNYHDSFIFRPIESYDYNVGNKQQEFLFAYRAFALGYYERHSSYEFRRVMLTEALEKNDSVRIESLKQECKTYGEHLKLIEEYKTSLNVNLDRNRFYKISSDVIVLPKEYHLAATSMFFILYDMEGNVVNNPESHISPTFFTFFPQHGHTYALFSYFTKDKAKFKFINHQILSQSIMDIEVIVSNIIATYIENFFISPKLWNALPSETKERFYQVYNNTLGKKPYRLAYFKDLNIFEQELPDTSPNNSQNGRA